MKTIYFKIALHGHTPMIFISHSGKDWYRKYPIEQLRYWIDYYLSQGSNIQFNTEHYSTEYLNHIQHYEKAY